MKVNGLLEHYLQQAAQHIDNVVQNDRFALHEREVGRLIQVSSGVARVRGLPNTKAMELLHFENGIMKCPGQYRLVRCRSSLHFKALEHGGADIQLAEDITQATGDMLLVL